jgi:hypothetical protein
LSYSPGIQCPGTHCPVIYCPQCPVTNCTGTDCKWTYCLGGSLSRDYCQGIIVRGLLSRD